jgi:hypothetical protein
VVNTARTVGTRAARQEHETSVAEEQTPTNGHPPSEIFDQQTGELLAEQQTGAYGGWTVYLDEEVVDSLPSQPPQALGLSVPDGSRRDWPITFPAASSRTARR